MTILSVYPLPLITYTHDASAVLISDNGVLYAYEEEKLSRFQHSISDFPEKSTMLGLKYSQIQLEEIQHLVITSMNNCSEQSDYTQKVQYIKDLLSLPNDIEVDCFPHHLAHSGLAVLTSPFDECIFLTMDAGGDGLMGHWGVYKDKQFNTIEQFELSPAIFYGYVSCLAGFSFFEEGKVMGLSSYGNINKELYGWFRKNFWIEKDNASMRISDQIRVEWESWLKPELVDADTFRRHKYFRLGVRFHENKLSDWFANFSSLEIAKTGQKVFEDLIIEAVSNIIRKTSIKNLALSGGAFQNIVVNGKLREIKELNIYVPMAPHDAGLALGAALIKWHQKTGRRPQIPLSAYLGPSFGKQEIESLIKSFSLRYEKSLNFISAVASALTQGKVVGWFQERAEFGARALGARSVLADPRNVEAKSRLNQALKKRDWFMPYAPSILEEYGNEYFENFSPSPYMNIGFRIKPEKIHLVPSAVHIDGSCRAHTVNLKQNPKYYQLLVEFYKLTGIPMILNTSFNRHGVPIISTPRQAIQHLLEGNVDVLVIEDFIVYREFSPQQKKPIYEDEYYLNWEKLLFAAKTLKRGRLSKARQIVDDIGLSIEVKLGAFENCGISIWETDQPEYILRNWWNDFWQKKEINND